MTGWHTEIPIHDAVRTANEFWLGLSRFTHIRAVILRAKRGYLMSNKRAALYMRVSTDAQTVENQTRDILKVTKSLGIGTGTVQRIANELR